MTWVIEYLLISYNFPFDFLFDPSDLCFPILSLISSSIALKSMSSVLLPFGDLLRISLWSVFVNVPTFSLKKVFFYVQNVKIENDLNLIFFIFIIFLGLQYLCIFFWGEGPVSLLWTKRDIKVSY